MKLEALCLLLLVIGSVVQAQKGGFKRKKKHRCGPPPVVPNAHYFKTGRNRVHYECDEGFEEVFPGMHDVTCEQGYWSVVSFECTSSVGQQQEEDDDDDWMFPGSPQEVTCPTPPEQFGEEHSELSPQGPLSEFYRPGYILCYTCLEGLEAKFEPVGYMNCTEEGTWVPLDSNFQCDITEALEGLHPVPLLLNIPSGDPFEICGPPGKLPSTRPPSTRPPSTRPPWTRPPSTRPWTRTASTRPPWTRPQSTSSPPISHPPSIHCPEPPNHPDMTIVAGLGGPYKLGHEVDYKCIMNQWSFVKIYCLPGGSWSPMNIRCPTVSPPTEPPSPGLNPCGDPPEIPHASYRRVMDQFIYQCNDGYMFLGANEVSIQCDVFFEKWIYSETEPPKCFSIQDLTTTTTTSPPTGGCSSIIPPDIDNGYYQYMPRDEGYMYHCDDGYELEGEPFYPCVVLSLGPVKGRKIPRCVAVRPNPPPTLPGHGDECRPSDKPEGVPHGSYEYDTATGRYQYTCEKDYDLVGAAWIQCIKGFWDTETPRCELKQCSSPGVPENGRRIDVDGKTYFVGSKVKYQCYSGYKLVGSQERTCQQNRKWNGSPVTCQSTAKISGCPAPAIPDGGRKNGNRYDISSTVEFACDPGAILYGSRERKCLPSGKWSGEETICDSPMATDTDEQVVTRIDNVLTDLTLTTQKGINVIFVFDVSDSIDDSEFTKSLGFAAKLVGELGISARTSTGATFGAVTFASRATTIFQTTKYKSITQCQQALQSINRSHIGARGTNIKSGLVKAKKMIQYTYERQVIRQTAKSVLFLFSDGLHNEGGDPIMTADTLKSDGCEIYAMSMKTRNHSPMMKSRLAMLASSPTRDHTVFTTKFDWDYVPDYSKCGVPGRTVPSGGGGLGDFPAQSGAWPWVVQVYNYHRRTKTFDLACTGALVDRSHVIVASTCVRGVQGMRKIRFVPVDGVDDAKTQERRVSHVFDEQHSPFHVAILRFKAPVEMNRNVRPVCLPTQETADKYGVVLGWCSENATEPAGLRQADVNLKDVDKCKTGEIIPVDPAKEQCIGSSRKGQCQKSCPNSKLVVVENTDSSTGRVQWTLSGVTLSEPDRCGLTANMISSRMSAYLQWINQMLGWEAPSVKHR